MAGLLLNTKATGHLHKAKDVKFQVPRGPQELAFAGVQIERQAAGLGCGAGVDLQTLGLVVHQTAVCGLAVDLHVQGVGREGQPVHTNKGRPGCAGRQAGPAARHRTGCFQPAELFARNRQTKFNAREAQARGCVFEAAVRVEAAVDASIGVQVRAANAEHVHVDLAGRFRHRAIARNLRIAQRHRVAALFYRQVALDAKETKHVQLKVATGLQ